MPLGVEPFPAPVFTGATWNQVPPGLRKVAKKHKKPDHNNNGGRTAAVGGNGGGNGGGNPNPWPTYSCDPTVVTCTTGGGAQNQGAAAPAAGPARRGGRRRHRPARDLPVGPPPSAQENPRTRLTVGVDAPGSTNTRFSGGAEPSGSAASRPVTPLAAALGSTTVLLAASVLGMVLAFAEKWPCRAGTTYAGQFQRACYTDILPLYYRRGPVRRDRLPTPRTPAATRSSTRC